MYCKFSDEMYKKMNKRFSYHRVNDVCKVP